MTDAIEGLQDKFANEEAKAKEAISKNSELEVELNRQKVELEKQSDMRNLAETQIEGKVWKIHKFLYQNYSIFIELKNEAREKDKAHKNEKDQLESEIADMREKLKGTTKLEELLEKEREKVAEITQEKGKIIFDSTTNRRENW